MPPLEIRRAAAADLPLITEIYEHAVRYGTATFELIPPARPRDDAGRAWRGGGYAASHFVARDLLDRHSGARSEPGISRFRVWSFGPSRNDGANFELNQRQLAVNYQQYAIELVAAAQD